METANCRSCGAEIRWVVMSATRRRAPLDFDPHPEGNVRLLADGTADVVPKAALGAARAGGPLYLSHFVTCPERRQWRRKGS